MKQRLKATERREVIYLKAKELFAKRGVAQTTTAAIAAAVGVSEPILYRHFSSKQKLFDSLLSIVISDVTVELGKHAEGDNDPVTTLRRIAIAYVELSEKYRDEFLIINRCLVEAKDRKTQNKLLEHYEKYVEFLSKTIREGQEQKMIRSDLSADTLAWHIIRSALGYVILKPLTADIPSISSSNEEIFDAVLSGILVKSSSVEK